jgi:hypothetical protein
MRKPAARFYPALWSEFHGGWIKPSACGLTREEATAQANSLQTAHLWEARANGALQLISVK